MLNWVCVNVFCCYCFSPVWGGGTQILFKKQEESLAVKLCSVCVTPFPLFHEFFRAGRHLPLLSFLLLLPLLLVLPPPPPPPAPLLLVLLRRRPFKLALERPKECHCTGGGLRGEEWLEGR